MHTATCYRFCYFSGTFRHGARHIAGEKSTLRHNKALFLLGVAFVKKTFEGGAGLKKPETGERKQKRVNADYYSCSTSRGNFNAAIIHENACVPPKKMSVQEHLLVSAWWSWRGYTQLRGYTQRVDRKFVVVLVYLQCCGSFQASRTAACYSS